ncbi:hypothetical protein JCM30760_21160 [Thiomicrorhabdus hydrogeniphila]
MGRYKSDKNYGWGKTINFAAKNALRDLYGHGHYSTVSTHLERWNQFVKYLKKNGIKDASHCEANHVNSFAMSLKALVENKEMEVAYAQNLLSTVNTILDAMGANKNLKVSPSEWVGKRSSVRYKAPEVSNRGLIEAKTSMVNIGLDRIVCLIDLVRELGLRSKEASLLNCHQAYKEALSKGSIAISKGTKGGRKRIIQVPNKTQISALKNASDIQGKGDNLIPSGMSWYEWKNGELRKGRELLKINGIPGFHDQRAAYACLRYEEITGYTAPVFGEGIKNKESDLQAREIIAQELGHNRIDVISSYIGGLREHSKINH